MDKVLHLFQLVFNGYYDLIVAEFSKKSAKGIKILINTPHPRYQHQTMLNTAIDSGHTNIAKLLISHGANIHAKDCFDLQDPLHWAVYKDNLELVQLLLSKNVAIEQLSETLKNTSPWNTPRTLKYMICETNNVKIVRLLINKGVTVDWSTKNEPYCPLFKAVSKYRNVELVKLLIDNGANVNGRTWSRQLSLAGIAIDHGDLEIAKLLLEKGASISFYLRTNYNKIRNALYDQKYEVAQLIAKYEVEQGCQTSIKKAMHRGAWDVADCLVEAGETIPSETYHPQIQKYKKHCLENLWMMDDIELYTNYYQWLPKEVSDDIIELLN